MSDSERAAVQDLRLAVAAGRLDLHEPASPPPLGRWFSDDDVGTTMRVLTIVWTSLTAVNFVGWGPVSGSGDGSVHPWWMWLSVPGTALLVRYVVGVGRPRR